MELGDLPLSPAFRMWGKSAMRLTHMAQGGGCACKIPAHDLERLVSPLATELHPDVLVGLRHGDDSLVMRSRPESGLVMTTDFFTPVVDDPYEFGLIAAANALSDVYAMGGTPIAALNIVGWPLDRLPIEVLADVLRGGADKCREAGVSLGGGHSIKDAEPKYGLAVTGVVDIQHLLRIDAVLPGTPLTLTKPIGVGILNNRHRATGERFSQAVTSMTELNRGASQAAIASGARAATDVTGFGLLGHLYKMMRASGTSAVIDLSEVPILSGARESLSAGYIPGGSVRNLEWVRPHVKSTHSEAELILLADAQTSGGLLVAGEVPGYPVIGHVTARAGAYITVR